MARVTVDLDRPSLYVEPTSRLYRLKRRLTFGTILKWVRRAAAGRQDFSLLELGTGSGYFMSFVEAEFSRATLAGIEYDPRLVEVARARVKRAAISQGNAEDFEFPGRTFDIIVSLQVIEHLYHPERMLALVQKHLAPGGVFIFTTPNLGGLGARLMGARWHARCVDHVSLKSFDEWRSFTESRGFTSIYCASTFFSGIPWLNRLPLGIANWALLLLLGAVPWKQGEAFVGVFRRAEERCP